MTVSMLTTRLSDVITGCGGNDTTCSRRSTLARTLSTNGTRKWRPPSRVRENLPSLSMISDVCCWTIRTVLTMTITANTTNSNRTINPALAPDPSNTGYSDSRPSATLLTIAVAPWMETTRTSCPGRHAAASGAVRADQVSPPSLTRPSCSVTVSYTHLRAHETRH